MITRCGDRKQAAGDPLLEGVRPWQAWGGAVHRPSALTSRRAAMSLEIEAWLASMPRSRSAATICSWVSIRRPAMASRITRRRSSTELMVVP